MLVWVLILDCAILTRSRPKRVINATDCFGANEDVTRDFVLWIKVMAIAGRTDRFANLVSGIDDVMEDIHKSIVIKLSVVDEPRIILARLDFDIVEEFHRLFEFFVALEHGVLENVAIETGTSKEKVLTFFFDLVVGDLRNGV